MSRNAIPSSPSRSHPARPSLHPFAASHSQNTFPAKQRSASRGKENDAMMSGARSGMWNGVAARDGGAPRWDKGVEEVSTAVNRDFEKLLDELQIAPSVRAQLTPLDTPVKHMLLSAGATGIAGRSSLALGEDTRKEVHQQQRQVRKVQSGGELRGGRTPGDTAGNQAKEMRMDGNRFVMVSPSDYASSSPMSVPVHRSRPDDRPVPLDLPQPPKTPTKLSLFTARRRGKSHAPTASVSGSSAGSELLPFMAGPAEPAREGRNKKKSTAPAGKERKDPSYFVDMFKTTRVGKMDVGKVKTVRMLLRHETTSWVEEFVDRGGYANMLRRLHELLAIEWRDEQHDDQLLHELLRCIKALSTSECGKRALQQHGAVPFRALTDLLYTDKRPGDLSTRQLIIELLIVLLNIYPNSMETSPAMSSSSMFAPPVRPWDSDAGGGQRSRPNSISFVGDLPGMPPLRAVVPNGYGTISGFVKSLLVPSPPTHPTDAADVKGSILVPAFELPSPKVEVHDFLEVAKLPRVYKTYLAELSDMCRDYFWIWCHGENCLWTMSELDVPSVAKPAPPCGASGGVEFEAMDYLTTHFRMLNALSVALAEQDMLDPTIRQNMRKGQAWQFHADMMMSGMDRILLTMRKASVDFYPHFHLEMARYVRHVQDAQLELPYPVHHSLGTPPERYRKRGSAQRVAERHLQADTGEPRGHQWLQTSVSFGNFDFQT